MSKLVVNGEVCSGTANYASAVNYTKSDGTQSTVQAELDSINGLMEGGVGMEQEYKDKIDEIYSTICGKKLEVIKVGNYSCNTYSQTYSIDCTGVEGYQNLTADNFFLDITFVSAAANGSYNGMTRSYLKTYNNSTGILSGTPQVSLPDDLAATIKFDLYVIVER